MKLLMILIYLSCFGALANMHCFDPEESTGTLYQYAEYACAGNNLYSLDDVLRNNSLKFSALESDNQNVGFTSDYYWLRFNLKNSGEEAKTYYLETARPITDTAILYQLSANNRERFESGDKISFRERQLPHRSTVFKIKLPAGSTTTFYLQLKSDGETINLPLRLYSEGDFWIHNYKQQLFLGLFYGLLLLAGIVYLFFYSSLSEKAFLYYGIYVFSIILFQASLDGLFFQYLLPSGGFWNDKAVLLTALLCNFFLLKYCQHFLKIGTNLPRLFRGFLGIYVFIGLLVLGTLLSPVTMKWVYPLSNINGLLSLLLILLAVGRMQYKRLAVDPYFAIGICFLVCGLLGFVLNNLSVLPNNFFTINSAKFGIGLEVIFLSLSMTNLIRNLRLEKENSQLLALKKSEEISGLKSFFMSNMSHELRTPLNMIMGIVDEQLAEGTEAEANKNYRMIRNASLSLLSNINDILDFDTIEKNALELRMEAFNPAEAITSISDTWMVQAREKGLNYHFEIDADLPGRIRADRQRLVQIINNLLSNAVKFTQQGKVCFKLKCIPRAKYNYRLHIEITDTGIGMDPERQARVFDSFSQMRLNNKRNFGGIGLGLSIVKYLVAAYKGEIRLESQAGEGTRVYLEIPVTAVPEVEERKGKQLSDAINCLPIKVLVVEDNKMNQLVMRKILGKADGMEHTIVENGQIALKILKEQTFDLILMDLQMPVLDGYETTAIIRGGRLGSHISKIPVIAVTADTTDATRAKVIETGMDDFVSKPVDADLLFEKIHQQVSRIKMTGYMAPV